MGKLKVDGNWILTREKETPDSERHLQERDDALFPSCKNSSKVKKQR